MIVAISDSHIRKKKDGALGKEPVPGAPGQPSSVPQQQIRPPMTRVSRKPIDQQTFDFLQRRK